MTTFSFILTPISNKVFNLINGSNRGRHFFKIWSRKCKCDNNWGLKVYCHSERII
jgi:hypothetical protein